MKSFTSQSFSGSCGTSVYTVDFFISILLGSYRSDHYMCAEAEVTACGRHAGTAESYPSGSDIVHGNDGGDDPDDAQQYVGCDGPGLYLGLSSQGA